LTHLPPSFYLNTFAVAPLPSMVLVDKTIFPFAILSGTLASNLTSSAYSTINYNKIIKF